MAIWYTTMIVCILFITLVVVSMESSSSFLNDSHVHLVNITKHTGIIPKTMGNAVDSAAIVSATSQLYSLPPGWGDFCKLQGFTEYQSEFTNETLYAVHCNVTSIHSGRWSMTDLRQNLGTLENRDVKLAVDIICTDRANISLSWPMKVKNLFRLRVKDCILTDFLLESKDEVVENTHDSLRELVLDDNTAVISIIHFIDMLHNIKYIHKEFDCGHDDTLERMTIRNMTYMFLESYDVIVSQLTDLGEQFILDAKRIDHTCDFKRLMYLEEGHQDSMSLYHMSLMTDNSIFYELRSYNLSHNKIKVLSDGQLKWSVLFPKLEVFDLSYNEISQLQPFTIPVHTRMDQVTTVNLQHNNISTVTVDDLVQFRELPMMFVDLRNNPINCSCSENMKELVKFIQNKNYLDIRVNTHELNYSYIEELLCNAPLPLHGMSIGSLTPGIVCPKGEPTTDYLLVPIIALVSSMVALSILMFVVLRYRQEILIILFTRFYIIIPCQSRLTVDDGDKRFDAFVSYSSKEGDWVEELFHTLEHPTESSSPVFRFCMHYRDFVPGKTIFENVIKSVESSRHTIIILSRNFIQSEFCLYEFQEAFRQSIMEQKRHLVIVMADDLAVSELPVDLRRCVNTFTYIRKDAYLFQERLIYALSVQHTAKHVKPYKPVSKQAGEKISNGVPLNDSVSSRTNETTHPETPTTCVDAETLEHETGNDIL